MGNKQATMPTLVASQREPYDIETTRPPHIAILKQINTLNEDGSYTYGFEAADGSFRVETRDKKGNVKGKYGYVDDQGDVKVVDYAAGGREGFNPQGEHLPIPSLPESLFDPSSTDGEFQDEFGNDEDWNSVDADEDGNPDPPRPHSQRTSSLGAAVSYRSPSSPPPSPPPSPSSRYPPPLAPVVVQQHHRQPNQHVEQSIDYEPQPQFAVTSPDPILVVARPTPGGGGGGGYLPTRERNAPTTLPPSTTPAPTSTSPPAAITPKSVSLSSSAPIAPLRPLFPPRQIIKVAGGLNKNYLPTPSPSTSTSPPPVAENPKQEDGGDVVTLPLPLSPPLPPLRSFQPFQPQQQPSTEATTATTQNVERRFLSPGSIFHQYRPAGYQQQWHHQQQPPPTLRYPLLRPDWP